MTGEGTDRRGAKKAEAPAMPRAKDVSRSFMMRMGECRRCVFGAGVGEGE